AAAEVEDRQEPDRDRVQDRDEAGGERGPSVAGHLADEERREEHGERRGRDDEQVVRGDDPARQELERDAREPERERERVEEERDAVRIEELPREERIRVETCEALPDPPEVPGELERIVRPVL